MNQWKKHGLILGFLTLLNVVNFMDRSVSLVIGEAIRKDLNLSDAQLGLLQGLAFALIYCVVAIPLSRLADRGHHRSVIGWSLLIWSAMTAMGAFAQSFTQLAATRVGVAAGEAGLTPASHSLLSRLFKSEQRGLAIGIFTLGLPLGIAAGAFAGGALVDAYGWRMCFLVVGPIGLLLFPLVFLILPKTEAAPRLEGDEEGVWHGVKLLMGNPAYRYLWFGAASASVFGYAVATFFAPFFSRFYGMSAMQIGAFYGGINIFGGVIGILVGGVLHDYVARRRPGRGLVPAVVALALSAPLAVAGYFAPDALSAMAFICAALLLYLLIGAPTYSLAQTIAPEQYRATSAALMGFSNGLIGASAGPLLVGMLSDVLTPRLGVAALRYSLASLAAFQLAGAYFFWRTVKYLSNERRI